MGPNVGAIASQIDDDANVGSLFSPSCFWRDVLCGRLACFRMAVFFIALDQGQYYSRPIAKPLSRYWARAMCLRGGHSDEHVDKSSCKYNIYSIRGLLMR